MKHAHAFCLAAALACGACATAGTPPVAAPEANAPAVESEPPAAVAGTVPAEIPAAHAGQSAEPPAIQAADALPAPALASCAKDSPVQRQFDFWLGGWSVRGPKGNLVGHNRIARLPGGCVLIETWRSVRGHTGTSLTYVHPTSKTWQQVWVDHRGGVLQLEGALVDDSMVLEGPYVHADGRTERLRAAWTPLEDGRVRQFIESSKDGGATWSVWFDGYYTRLEPRGQDMSGVPTLD